MPAAARIPPLIPFRYHSLRVIKLAPQPPLADWLVALDESLPRAPSFFRAPGSFLGRAVLLDVSALWLNDAELKALLSDLLARNIRIMAVEGPDPPWRGPGRPPRGKSCSQTGAAELMSGSGPPVKAPNPQAAARVVEGVVRSGQSI